MWIIEDELHGEPGAEFETRDEAIAELRRLATLAWDEPPNKAPCMSWRTCGRNFYLVECDCSNPHRWRDLRRDAALNVSADKTEWLLDA